MLLNVFVRHEGFDRDGNPLPDDGSAFPGRKDSKKDSNKNVVDPGLNDSADDTEEDIDYNNDAEESAQVHTHMFTIDLVTRYPD